MSKIRKRIHKPLSPEKQAKKNAALLAKRRANGVKPKKILTVEQRKAARRKVTAEYRQRNRERLLEERIVKREEIREKGRDYYNKNKDIVMAASKRWKKRNPDRVRVACQNYRAKKRANGGVLSKDIAKRLMRLQRSKCAACRVDISEQFHIDHIIPVASGGEHSDLNVQLLCPTCNMSKQAQHPVDFMQKKGFLL